MRNPFLGLLYFVFLLSGSLAGDESLAPNRENWADFYDPPFTQPTELPVDSDLRRQLFDLLRVKLTARHRFEGSLKVFRNWAFFSGRTVDEKGSSLPHPPHGNDDAVALWLRTGEGWKRVDSSFGHSDAFYLTWPGKFGAPDELFGLRSRK